MSSTMELVDFGKSDIGNVMSKMSEKDINGLAFGAIQLGASGRIMQ